MTNKKTEHATDEGREPDTGEIRKMDEHPMSRQLREQDLEIARLRAENEITASVCNQNTNLKKALIELAGAVALYLSLDGSDKIYDAVKLQGARVKLRQDIQRAKETLK